MKVTIMLPALNEESSLPGTLKDVRTAIDQYPWFDWSVWLINMGSTDETRHVAITNGLLNDLPIVIYDAPKSEGLATALKTGYLWALRRDPDYIIRTDVDCNPKSVIWSFIPHVARGVEFAVASRNGKFPREKNDYESNRREDVLNILYQEFGISGFDPLSMGNQLLKAPTIQRILSNEVVQKYDKSWGLDLMVALTAIKGCERTKIVNMLDGNYDASRRPRDKIQAQYDAYIEIVAGFTKKDPRELSLLYKT